MSPSPDKTVHANAVDALGDAEHVLRQVGEGGGVGFDELIDTLRQLADATAALPSPGICNISIARHANPEGWSVSKSIDGAGWNVELYAKTIHEARLWANAYRAGYTQAGGICRVDEVEAQI